MKAWLRVLAMALPAMPLAAQDSVEEGSAHEDQETYDPIVLIHNGPHDWIVVEGGVLVKPLSDRADPVRYIMDPDQGTGIRVENIVRDIPGFQQFRRSDSRSANPTSQGLTSRGLGGNAASRALLILDGVPQSDPFGGWVNWTAFDALNLKGMRIINGGGSGTDGPGALAGTIQLSTTRGPIGGSLAFGERNSVDADLNVGFKAGNDGAMAFSGNYSRGDGFIPIIASQRGAIDRAAGYQSYGLGARFVANTDDVGRIEAAIRTFDDKRSRGLPFSDNRNSGVDASIRVLPEIAGMSSLLLAYAQLREFSSQFGAVSADRQTVTPTLDQFDVPSTGLGARFEIRPVEGGFYNDRELRLGLDWRRTSGTTRENSNYVAGAPTRSRQAGGVSETFGAFSEWSMDEDRFSIAASLRVDHWSIRDGRRLEVNIGGSVRSDDRFADRSGWEWTGRLSGSWSFADPVKAKFAVYHGWRLPTLNELYRPFRVGPDATAANDALRPERIHGGEVRIENNVNDADLDLTLFFNRLDRAIANVTLGQGPGTFPGVGFVATGGIYRQRQNLDAIVSKGVELNASFSINSALEAGFGYTYVDAQVNGNGLAALLDGLRPAQVPKNFVTAGMDFDNSTWRGGFSLRYIGGQFEDDANSRRLKDALTADGYIGYMFKNGFGMDLHVENLFGARVEAAISNTGIIERANPRTIWIGVRYTLD
jgi:vitamin B12 transporter